ncbi:3-oxoacyl-ACP synthase III family protein [Gilvimarinus sp. F26214L]|uniref:3-oxoacyl-ACP synthase III family protein n=1 Tax=Gilvimarinus sp. DZF01 TaxID=3461371 RepID=UPI0040451A55
METLGNSHIAGIGTYLPRAVVSSDELMKEVNSERFGVPAEYLSRHIGIEERREADRSQCPSDLASLASQSALRDAGASPDEVDLIIFTGITRDYEEPSTAHNVQHKIGASRAACMDISNACLGFMTGLSVADAYINSGMAETVLVCSGEVPSQTRDLFMPLLKNTSDKRVFKTKLGVLTVGDAGGAMLIRRKQHRDQGWEWFRTESDGAHSELCYYAKKPGGFEGQMVMDKICAVTLTRHAKVYKKARAKVSWFGPGADVSYCHQVGAPPHRVLAQRFDLDPAKAPISYDRFGNLTTATIPVLMDLNRPQRGQKIQFFCSGSGISVFQGGMIF